MATSEFLDLTALTDEQLDQLGLDVEREKYAREMLVSASGLANQIAIQYHESVNRGLPDGELPAWTQPTGAHDAYPEFYVVTHNEKTWECLTPACVWEPGVSGWREIVEDGGPPASWIQPTGVHDAYPAGAIVSHNEFIWVSDLDGNVWEPGVYGWTKQ